MTALGYLHLPRINVKIAASIEDALRLLDEDSSHDILAGGTYTIPSIIEGFNKQRKFIDISRLGELRYIRETGERVSVGALTKQRELAEKLGEEIPAFSAFLRNYSAPSVANLATVGGSIMLSSCSEDLIPILLTLDAELTFRTGKDEKKIPLNKFIESNIRERMLLTEISFKKSGKCFFSKLWLGVSRIPLISVAVNIDDVTMPRVAVSHFDGDRPGRAYSVEYYLRGKPLNVDTVKKAAEMLSESINPSSDVLASSWYRRDVAGVLLERILKEVKG